MTVTVGMLRGCGEQLNNYGSLLWQLAAKVERLAPGRFEFVDVPYNAVISMVGGGIDGQSLNRNAVDAYPIVDKIVRDTPNLVMLWGYSQGAYTGSRWLARKPDDCIVPWAMFVANPLRREGDSWDRPGAPGYGIAGQHDPWPDDLTHWEIANPGDGITCAPGNSPLRTLTDIVDPLTFALGGGWSRAMLDKLLDRRFQLMHNPLAALFAPGRYSTAAVQMASYLSLRGFRPEHGGVYFEDGYIDRIAETIAREV
jgi:hypothetical protein